MADQPTLDYMLTQMAQDKECLAGWDAVLNVVESSINEFFQTQYQKMTGNTGQMTMSQIFCGPAVPFHKVFISHVTEYTFTLGKPSFTFVDGKDEVTVKQDIVSGSWRVGTMEVAQNFDPSSCGCTPTDSRITWQSANKIEAEEHYYLPQQKPWDHRKIFRGPELVGYSIQPSLSATVPLSTVTGLLNADTHTVVLDFAQGSFTATDVTITGVDSQKLSAQIKSYFMTHDVKYQIASLDFTNGSSLASLTPTSFKLRVYSTNAGNQIVQILIVTDGTASTAYPIVTEPIPTASGYSCSLMISSRIVFSDILCAGFNAAGKAFKLYPQNNGTAQGYGAYISPQMHFSGSFSYGSCCDKTTVKYSIYLGGTYTGTATQGFHLYQSVTPKGNVGNTITVSGFDPMSLSGAAAVQQINITATTPSVSVTGGASGKINSELTGILGGPFKAAMSDVSFTPVSYFALRNILFPGSLMKMSVVQVPTDLVIVGTFEPS